MVEIGYRQKTGYNSLSVVLVVVSGMQLKIVWRHVDHIHRDHYFRQCEIMESQILLYGAQPCDAGRPRGPLQSSEGRVDRIRDSLGICYCPYAQCAQKGSGDVIGLLQ